jgi:TRAP-type C4-dicarboxylate transport system permease small subunit
MIQIFIGICAVLAVIMIVWGGIEYMTSELISGKDAGRERIRDAVFGLILALGAWLLLYTINPQLLNSEPNIAPAGANATIPSPASPATTGK